MSDPPRGRGYAMHNKASAEPLRRPGDFGGMECYGNDVKNDISEKSSKVVEEDQVLIMCNKISNMGLADPKQELQAIEIEVISLCDSVEHLQNLVDKIFLYALKSKWNAHAIALFSENYADISVKDMKFRSVLLKKLQGLYLERNKSYQMLEKFLMDVTFFCEIYHHLKISGNCIQVLSQPIIDYFGMLIDGGSLNEVEVFCEQFPKCFNNLQANKANNLEILVTKIRKQLVGDSTKVTVRAKLLEMFEMILTDWKPLSQDASTFYSSLSKPTIRICE